jgi:hypothetical protein
MQHPTAIAGPDEVFGSAISIRIPDDCWERSDGLEGESDIPERYHLRPFLTINGCPMHLEAWRVVEPATSSYAQEHYYAEDFDNLFAAVGADGSWQTTTIKGHEYILVASPFC